MTASLRWLRCIAFALLIVGAPTSAGSLLDPIHASPSVLGVTGHGGAAGTDPVANFTTAVQRLVELVGFAGSGLLTLVWVRVALSWFSNDLAKKIQAKDRARDALIGTLIFTAALSGLVWGLAQWVFTGA